ncbi:hypothetical protein WG901_17570 [Novosphingobium sp. PS1R-30]|uniref:Uncharacterized protein n=1 Tax=Novosphingobium anseongense TaxID=3133436 RepID=A0ABU8RZF8_9SPHN
MTPPIAHRALTALQCAVTLVAILGGIGMIAWLAGLVAIADLPYALSGVFGGSFIMGLIKQRQPPRTVYRA